MQAVVSIFVYDIKLKRIKRKFKWETLLNLQDEHLTLIKVAKSLEEKPNQHFKRIHSREFQFLGEMYDIVRKTEHRDSTYYYCFHDHDESVIIRNINRWMHDNFGNSTEQKNTGDFQKDFFEKDYLVGANLQVASYCFVLRTLFNNFSTRLSTGFESCFCPPPEQVA
jgi:hypothetical protein